MRTLSLGALGVILFLSACGGGPASVLDAAGSPADTSMDNITAPTATPDSGLTTQTGVLGAPIFGGGSAYPTAVVFNNSVQAIVPVDLSRGLFSDGTRYYRVAQSSDGTHLAMAGFTETSAGIVGSFVETATSAPTGGTATYSGPYQGILVGPFGSATDDIRGTLTMAADFDAGQMSGTISGRGATTIAGYQMGQIVSDVEFSGNLAANGAFAGLHEDWNSIGEVSGIVHGSGAVGIVNIRHPDAAGSGIDVHEVGAFTVE